MKTSRPDRVTIESWATCIDDFDVVIDARSEREFLDDHIPGAMSLPVVRNDEYAEVGTLHKTDTHGAYLLGVRYSMLNIAEAIETTIYQLPKDTRILVYCFRGGKRSKLWSDALTTIGYHVMRLEGGWKAYRAWVRDSLNELPKRFNFRVLCGPTGCGKTRCLEALDRAGAQILDLENLAKHRGSLIGHIPDVTQPPQKLFDSLLLERLRTLDPSRPVWVESESKKIGALTLPSALFDAIHLGTVYRIEAAMPQRVALWREEYGHFEQDPAMLLSLLTRLRPVVGGEEFELWKRLGTTGEVPALFERLMRRHYDIAYDRSIQRHYPTYNTAKIYILNDLSATSLDRVAQALLTA